MPLPCVMTIAGSDSSGGAGIEADLKTFSAHKVYGLTCITALTAQNTLGVGGIHPTPRAFVDDILDHNFKDFLYDYKQPLLKVIKTGMLTSAAVDSIVSHADDLDDYGVKLVVDPVMISTSGAQLFDESAMESCLKGVIKGSYILTPNFQEAQVLYKISCGKEAGAIRNKEDMVSFVKELQQVLGCVNLLVKGGHIPWNESTDQPFKEGDDISDKRIIDILYQSEEDTVTVYESVAIDSQDTHGTGCTLSSAIAANLAHNHKLTTAVGLGIEYIHKAMTSMPSKLGRGNGPLNHCVVPDTRADTVKQYMFPGSKAEGVFDCEGSVLDYFKNHPQIIDNWKVYAEHEFVRQLAQNKLPLRQFLYFLKQDYHYLVNYAQIQALAASVAPTYKQTHLESTIINSIVEEIEHHKSKLSKEYDIDYDRDWASDLELSPGNACKEYCQYLLDIGRKEDYIGVKVALAPCLHGYYDAGNYGQTQKNLDTSTEIGKTYDEWLNEYVSDWYTEANEKGKQTLETVRGVSIERLNQLIDIFNHVTQLEISFWDEVLQQ